MKYALDSFTGYKFWFHCLAFKTVFVNTAKYFNIPKADLAELLSNKYPEFSVSSVIESRLYKLNMS